MIQRIFVQQKLLNTGSLTISFKRAFRGFLDGSAVEHLPLAQGEVLESRDRVPHRASCTEPASLSAYVSASLSVSLMNK